LTHIHRAHDAAQRSGHATTDPLAAPAEIERPQLQLAGLHRNRVGRRSEQLDDTTSQQGEEDLERSVAEQQDGLDAVLIPVDTPWPEPDADPADPPRAWPVKRNRGA
jgi:hypothetical protein